MEVEESYCNSEKKRDGKGGRLVRGNPHLVIIRCLLPGQMSLPPIEYGIRLVADLTKVAKQWCVFLVV